MTKIEDLPLYAIREFMIESLKGNSEFDTFLSGLGVSPMKYYEDSNSNEVIQEDSYFISYGITNIDDGTTQIEKTAGFIVGITGDIDQENVNEVYKFTAQKTVEQIAYKALEIIRCAIRDFGINNVRNLLVVSNGVMLDERNGQQDYAATVSITIMQNKTL